MSGVILDASAVLAVAYEEPGAEVVPVVAEGMSITAVNHAEVVGKLIDDGFDADQARETVHSFGYEVVDFDADLAFRAGLLRRDTRALGLSLGDRACLALAQRAGLPVFTADKRWAELNLGVDIRVIR